jgi:hypothetical protein
MKRDNILGTAIPYWISIIYTRTFIFTCLLKQWLRVFLLKKQAEIRYSTTEVSVAEREWTKVDMAVHLGRFLLKISNGTFEILT